MTRCHDNPAGPVALCCRIRIKDKAMPGRSQQGGRGKQESSKERLSPASQRYCYDGTGSFDCLIIPLMLHKSCSETVRKPTIWPEWTEAELAAEKWDLGGGKGRAKSSAINAVNSSIVAFCYVHMVHKLYINSIAL